MNYIEIKLSNFFNKGYCCFTGNGTTAMYLIFKALNIQNKSVLYPDITCTNPVNAAVYAGYKVVFSDVNLYDYTMNVDSLEYMIKKYNVGIVVPTHIYGHRCNIKKIKHICKKYNVFVLEDAAQSTYFDDNSDAAIISFGHTKIFQSIGEGGAIFTNNKDLFNKVKKLKNTIKPKPLNSIELFDQYREEYYKIINSHDDLSIKNKNIYDLQIKSKEKFIFHEEVNDKIIEILNKKNNIIQSRKNKSKLYSQLLVDKKVKKPNVDLNDITLWRYSFLFEGNRDKLLNLSRYNNIDISSWYKALHNIYIPDTCEKFENSNYVEKHIVNLWIDDTHIEDKIKKEIKVLNDIMRGIKYE